MSSVQWQSKINPLMPGRFKWFISEIFLVKSHWGECHSNSLMSQHWISWWFGVLGQQAITWINVDQFLWSPMAQFYAIISMAFWGANALNTDGMACHSIHNYCNPWQECLTHAFPQNHTSNIGKREDDAEAVESLKLIWNYINDKIFAVICITISA